jgi:hypothetical protein
MTIITDLVICFFCDFRKPTAMLHASVNISGFPVTDCGAER